MWNANKVIVAFNPLPVWSPKLFALAAFETNSQGGIKFQPYSQNKRAKFADFGESAIIPHKKTTIL
jgi:hypothetical protein